MIVLARLWARAQGYAAVLLNDADWTQEERATASTRQRVEAFRPYIRPRRRRAVKSLNRFRIAHLDFALNRQNFRKEYGLRAKNY